MAIPLHAPRVNNNDDTVRVLRLLVRRGDAVRAGDLVAEVETEKANVTVEADRAGIVLAVLPQVQDVISVGSVLVWLGATIDDPVPDAAVPDETRPGTTVPTVKAAQLLERYGLSAPDVTASAGRLRVRDVEAYVDSHGLAPIGDSSTKAAPSGAPPLVPGTRQALTPGERGMLRTVLWHRQEAVPGYVELQYDAGAWDRAAADYQRQEDLLLNPLLAMMAYRLTRIATGNSRLTSTLIGEERWVYETVNLGFTVQSDTTLYLAVVADAAALTCAQFIARLTTLQRQALAHQLRRSDTTGATIGFSSMARWHATRHIPVLSPHTALMVAHAAATPDGRAILGATYDHRVLTGSEALSAITALSRPED